MKPGWGAGFKGTGIIRNATVPACLLEGVQQTSVSELTARDIVFENGKLTQIAPAGTLPEGAGGLDLDGGLVLPTLVDVHTHLDKGHIWPREPNPDGTFQGALQAVGRDRSALLVRRGCQGPDGFLTKVCLCPWDGRNPHPPRQSASSR
jgi:cytosine deaminase